MQQLSTDPVPNVRFNVAKTLQKISGVFDHKFMTAEVKPLLAHLAEDKEFDVRFFAGEARDGLRLG